MSSKKSKDEPELDPYDVLGVDLDASEAAISRAYKKLALKLHPDKQPTNQNPAEAERVAQQFQTVQQARAFLLDPEHREARAKYDAKRASIQQRRQADAKRVESMNGRRTRQLDELNQREKEAERHKKKIRSSASSKTKSKQEDELIEKLRKGGQELREQKAKNRAEAAAFGQARNDKQDRQQKERHLQNRQVRLKWSRKVMETSPSEHSLASLLSRFGTVEEVELLGSKGNMALITFEFPSSCRPCVNFYRKSGEMRAFFVGKRKEEEEALDAHDNQERDSIPVANNQRRDQESVQNWKIRQADEREKLLREMEAEEAGEEFLGRQERGFTEVNSICTAVNFPSKYKHLTPIQRLESVEEAILGQILSGSALTRLKELHS